jgi:hypothetical protein
MLPVVGQLVHRAQRARRSALATTLAVAGYLLGNVLELVFGDLAAVAKPLLIGHRRLIAAWLFYRHVSDHRPGSRPER